MPTITTRDGAQIFYKDWGSGQPVVFSHGWPLNADAWDEQLFLFASNRFRAIAHDRRGHGRSTQTWRGSDMDTYADDLATCRGLPVGLVSTHGKQLNMDLLDFARQKGQSSAPGRRGSAEPASRAAGST